MRGGYNGPWNMGTLPPPSLQTECACFTFWIGQGPVTAQNTCSILDLNIFFCDDSDLFLVYSNNDRGILPIFLCVERKPNPFEMAWRSSRPIAFVTAQQACCNMPRRWPSRTCPLLSCTVSLHRRWPLHGLTHAPGARADRFICTQSQRTAASHSNCISAHGEGKDLVVHITVAETNLAEMEGEMEKAHLLH